MQILFPGDIITDTVQTRDITNFNKYLQAFIISMGLNQVICVKPQPYLK